jgi:hypothetical protein
MNVELELHQQIPSWYPLDKLQLLLDWSRPKIVRDCSKLSSNLQAKKSPDLTGALKGLIGH